MKVHFTKGVDNVDDFKKPYEYVEEKGTSGMLLILFFMLIAIEPFIGILSIFVFKDVAKGSNVLATGLTWVSAVYIVFSLLSGITLKRVSRIAIPVVKAFLVFRLLYLAPVVSINTWVQIGAIPYEKTYIQYAAEYNSIMTSFAVSISYVLVFSVCWFIFLIRSKKVRESFPRMNTAIKEDA